MAERLMQKYLWIMRTLISAGESGLTFEQISSRWRRQFGSDYSRRTFNNHREMIFQNFNVDIRCNRSTYRYYIPFSADVMDSNNSVSWLVDTFTVNEMLSLGKERLSGRVSVDEIPSGHKYLSPIMEAMQQNRQMKITYAKYDGSAADTFHINPYAVKENARRWYVVAFCLERNALRVYGLDRITALEETGEVFSLEKNFDVDDLFNESYGIYLPEGKPAVTITFTAGPKEARYLKDLPLHHSQKVLSVDENGTSTLSIRVIPNENLIMELCKRGSRIKVLSPDSVRNEVADALRQAASLYDE